MAPAPPAPKPRILAPLPPKIQRFIECYISCRDLNKAAERCGFPIGHGIKLYRVPRIYREIHRRMQVVEQEQAVFTAVAIALNAEMLDAELVSAIQMPIMPGMAAAKVGALKLGYGRLGILVDPDSVPPAPPTFPPMYNYLFQQKMQNAQGDTVTNTVAVEGKTPLELPAAPVPQPRPRDRNDEILVEIEGELRD